MSFCNIFYWQSIIGHSLLIDCGFVNKVILLLGVISVPRVYPVCNPAPVALAILEFWNFAKYLLAIHSEPFKLFWKTQVRHGFNLRSKFTGPLKIKVTRSEQNIRKSHLDLPSKNRSLIFTQYQYHLDINIIFILDFQFQDLKLTVNSFRSHPPTPLINKVNNFIYTS